MAQLINELKQDFHAEKDQLKQFIMEQNQLIMENSQKMIQDHVQKQNGLAPESKLMPADKQQGHSDGKPSQGSGGIS
jgi:hypothetical protein